MYAYTSLASQWNLNRFFHRLAYNIKHFTHQIQYSERTAKKMIRSHWIYLEVSKDIYQYWLSWSNRKFAQLLLQSTCYVIFIISFVESEAISAQALYDFNARSSREVDFRKGDSISLFKQVSGDWWRGSVNGKEGLIPDKYIILTMK